MRVIVVKIIRFEMRIFEFSISQVFTDYIYSIAELPSPTDPGDMENASSSFPMVSMLATTYNNRAGTVQIQIDGYSNNRYD